MGARYIDTALENTLLSKGLKGIRLCILEKMIDLHLCITSKYHKLLLLLHLLLPFGESHHMFIYI